MKKSIPSSRYWCFAVVAGLALAWDLISKSWVFGAIGYPYGRSEWSWSHPVLWGTLSARLQTHLNSGALWGIGQGYSWLFAALSVVAALLILYWLFIRGEASSWWMTVCLSLIMGGTLGNLYDRLHLHGCVFADGTPAYGVRDFLDVTIPWWIRLSPLGLVRDYDWPIFNFADAYLVTGAIMLTTHSFRCSPSNPPSLPDQRSEPGQRSPEGAPSEQQESPAVTVREQ